MMFLQDKLKQIYNNLIQGSWFYYISFIIIFLMFLISYYSYYIGDDYGRTTYARVYNYNLFAIFEALSDGFKEYINILITHNSTRVTEFLASFIMKAPKIILDIFVAFIFYLSLLLIFSFVTLRRINIFSKEDSILLLFIFIVYFLSIPFILESIFYYSAFFTLFIGNLFLFSYFIFFYYLAFNKDIFPKSILFKILFLLFSFVAARNFETTAGAIAIIIPLIFLIYFIKNRKIYWFPLISYSIYAISIIIFSFNIKRKVQGLVGRESVLDIIFNSNISANIRQVWHFLTIDQIILSIILIILITSTVICFKKKKKINNLILKLLFLYVAYIIFYLVFIIFAPYIGGRMFVGLSMVFTIIIALLFFTYSSNITSINTLRLSRVVLAILAFVMVIKYVNSIYYAKVITFYFKDREDFILKQISENVDNIVVKCYNPRELKEQSYVVPYIMGDFSPSGYHLIVVARFYNLNHKDIINHKDIKICQ